MNRLKCLSVEGLPYVTMQDWRHVILREVEASIFNADDFHCITISYTWEPAKGETKQKRGFEIQTLDGKRVRNEARDIVIWRAIRYLQHHSLKGFWIDRQCLVQDDDEQHAIAMNSMDRLYNKSPCSVGLMTTNIDQQWKLDML